MLEFLFYLSVVITVWLLYKALMINASLRASNRALERIVENQKRKLEELSENNRTNT